MRTLLSSFVANPFIPALDLVVDVVVDTPKWCTCNGTSFRTVHVHDAGPDSITTPFRAS